MKKQFTTKTLSFLSISLAVAILLQIIESMVDIPIPVPGVKLGLANIVALVVIFKIGSIEATIVNILRILLGSILRGTFGGPAFYLALAGGIVATILLIATYKSKLFTMFGISILSAVGHVIGQMVAITIIFGTLGMLYYLPILLLLGAASGILTGYIASITLKNIRKLRV